MSALNGDFFEESFTPHERQKFKRIMRRLDQADPKLVRGDDSTPSEAKRESGAGEPVVLLVIGLSLILVGVVLVSSLIVIVGALVSLTALVVAVRRSRRATPPS